MDREKIFEEISLKFGIDLCGNDLHQLFSFFEEDYKYMPRLIKDTKIRLNHLKKLKKTLLELREKTLDLFRKTNSPILDEDEKTFNVFKKDWRLALNDPTIEDKILPLNQIGQINEIIGFHEALLKRLEFINKVSPLGWLILNLAYIIRHTDYTTPSRIHVGDISWQNILLVLEYSLTDETYALKSEFLKIIPYTLDEENRMRACDALRKRYKEAERKAREMLGDDWENILILPSVRRLSLNRKKLDQAHEEAWEALQNRIQDNGRSNDV